MKISTRKYSNKVKKKKHHMINETIKKAILIDRK